MHCVKRLFDVLAAIAGMMVLAVPMLAIAILVRLHLGSPILFRQQRAGKHGALFELVKFRTMAERHDARHRLLSDALRIDGFGRFLRTSSLDELPELWNVLRGDMSIVGPRPLLPQYLPLYSPDQARRHEVRPGITGWAQVNGRNAISWSERFALDVWYVDHAGFWLDLRILFRTVLTVLRRQGIGAEGDVTMPAFRGNGEPE
jgi:lipopolysaccharide/colanic/teichoic acid biosynthesis glycosyltransferase